MSRVQVPGRVDIGCVIHKAPSAYPVSMQLNTNLVAWGGLTKLEWMAGMVVAGSTNNSVDTASPADCKYVVKLAAYILAECEEFERRHNAQTKEQDTQ